MSPVDPMIEAETTEDTLLGGRVRLRQPVSGFRTSIDALLLAAAVDPEGGAQVAEFGAGSGAASLCLARRVPEADVTGFEIDTGLVALANRNALENGVAAQVRFVTGDVTRGGVAANAFDQIMANPPYWPSGSGRRAAAETRERAMRMAPDALDAWIVAARRALRPRGTLTLILSADRLGSVVGLLGEGFGDIRLLPLWPKQGLAAKRVLIRARKGVRSPSRLLPGMVLHEATGRFTAVAENVLRHAAALTFE